MCALARTAIPSRTTASKRHDRISSSKPCITSSPRVLRSSVSSATRPSVSMTSSPEVLAVYTSRASLAETGPDARPNSIRIAAAANLIVDSRGVAGARSKPSPPCFINATM